MAEQLYKVIETGKFALQYKGFGYTFDRIFNFHVDIGTGTYTEGTGNLANIKGATNPVTAKFRKMQGDNDSDTITTGQTVLYNKINEKAIHTINQEITNPTTGKVTQTNNFAPTSKNPHITDNTIYEWIAKVNAGALDRDDFTVYGEVDIYTINENKTVRKKVSNVFLELFELKGTLLTDAVIRRNTYRGQSFSELTFLADSISPVVTKEDFEVIASVVSEDTELAKIGTVINYKLTVTASPAEGGAVSLPQESNQRNGAQISVTATPNTGYTFKSWSASGVAIEASAATNATLTFTMPANDVALTATFEKT